jgi:hypothetical protein
MAKKGTKLVEIVARVLIVGFMQMPAFSTNWAVGLPRSMSSMWVAKKY